MINQYLITPYNTLYDAFPFDRVRDEDYEDAILYLIQKSKDKIQSIANSTEEPSFESVITALERSDELLRRAVEAFFNIHNAESNDVIEQAAEKLSPELATLSNDILLNAPLFDKIKKLYDKRDSLNLDSESLRLLEQKYKSFVRNGALLSDDDKVRLRAIDQELSLLKVQFSQNVLQETNDYELILTEPSEVDGLPDSILRQAASLAKSKGKEGYLFNLQFPSFVPFMKYAKNRTLRAQMHRAYGMRAYQDNDRNNESIVKQIVNLKLKRAQLLGFAHHADFVIQERMAEQPSRVYDLLDQLLEKALPKAKEEIAQLQSIAKGDGIDVLMPYDHAYYAEQWRQQAYDYNEELLKPYFSLDATLAAAFDLAHKLFDLSFHRVNVPTYHEEVTVYEVQKAGKYYALLYLDFHPRQGKRAGAWMTSFKGQYKTTDKDERPHISIVCNFSRPTDTEPSLLTFQEVTTLFHEFGHALHGMLANTQYESLSGTNVYWDFVELPSQFMENYCYEKEFIQSFAKHWQTSDMIIDADIDKIVASANFMEAYQTVRQVSFGYLDMAYHTLHEPLEQDIKSFELTHLAKTMLYPDVKDTAMSPSFSHIFGGGYSAGYYSYKWSEVLDADAFAYFKEKGIFDKETALKFEHLLSSGGSVPPMELYRAFRGQEPTVDALLKRAGIA